jgi:lysophospholipase L1-like esterase
MLAMTQEMQAPAMTEDFRSATDRRKSACCLAAALILFIAGNASAAPKLVIVGDSLGEGVQAADAAWQTQIYAYGAWVAKQLGAELVIPYIQSSPLGVVGDTTYRRRLFPSDVGTNVSVSGANVDDALTDKTDAATPSEIDDENALVMYPRRDLTQIDFVEQYGPDLVLCWIGANDALGAVTAYDALDASQLTEVDTFTKHYTDLAQRLANGNRKVVFATIPDVTDIGFLVDRPTAEQFLGFPVSLADGEYTTVVALLLIALEGDADLLTDPDFYLDKTEIEAIQDRISAFNAVIQQNAAELNMPLVDLKQWFEDVIDTPPSFFGVALRPGLLGGVFSLDQVHPSNISHALIANEFIEAINSHWQMDVPLLSRKLLGLIFLTDPSIDKDGDGRARGRPGVGLLESLSLIVGLTGDRNDFVRD